jgi:hypothetical protein
MPTQHTDTCVLHVALVAHEHGSDYYAAATETALTAKLARFCRTHWASEEEHHPGLPDTAPDEDTLVIAAYFDAVTSETLQQGTAPLEPLRDLATLDDETLTAAHEDLQALTATVLTQRAALASEHARRLIRAHAPTIATLTTAYQPHSLNPTVFALDTTGGAVELDQHLAPRELQKLNVLLAEFASISGGPHVIHAGDLDPNPPTSASGGGDDERFGVGFPDREEVLARIRREQPARSGKRRIRWRSADLRLVAELAEAESTALQVHAEQNPGEYLDEIDAADKVAEIARALIDARTAPASSTSATTVEEAQVAYLLPVEVLVDLAEQRVTRVVALDELFELDAEEGVRAASTLLPLQASQALHAVAIAELLNGGEWPATQFSW